MLPRILSVQCKWEGCNYFLSGLLRVSKRMGVGGEKTTRILDPIWGGFGDSVGEREEVKLRMELDPGLGKKEPRHVRAPSLMAQSRQSL